MGIQPHALSTRIIMDIVGAGTHPLGVQSWREARFGFDATAGERLGMSDMDEG